MNKAFTKEDEGDGLGVIPPRAPLPEGTPNYVTPRGLELLHEERDRMDAERSEIAAITDEAERRRLLAVLAVRVSELDDRIATAVPVPPPTKADDLVRFGATVRVRAEDGSERVHRIVGVDEADAERGLIAFVSPIARALLGKREGDAAVVHAPHGPDELEITSVTYTT